MRHAAGPANEITTRIVLRPPFPKGHARLLKYLLSVRAIGQHGDDVGIHAVLAAHELLDEPILVKRGIHQPATATISRAAQKRRISSICSLSLNWSVTAARFWKTAKSPPELQTAGRIPPT